MDKHSIFLEGKNLEELIAEGLEELGRTEDEVDVKVINKGKSLGPLSLKKYRIEIKVKDTINDKQESKTSNNDKYINSIIEKQHFDNDIGTYSISFLEDGVYISVTKGDIVSPTLEEVMAKLIKKEVENPDIKSIKQAIKEANGTPIKIANNQKEKIIDSKLNLEISEDKMKAYISIISPEGGKELLIDEVISMIKKDIKIDINIDEINKALNQKVYDQKILIAEGTHSIDGKDGYIVYKFNTAKNEGKPAILEDGSVDFRNLDLISNVSKGDILAEKIACINGHDGINVVGDILEHKTPKDAVFKYGKDVIESEDGNTLISDADGQVCLEVDKIVVHDIYTVNTDIDNSTGNINFNGSVKIKGNVITGFEVVADGNVEIDGVVEGATIKCGGNLVIKRGIQGYNMAKIHSDGDIICKFIENTEMYSSGDIESEAIMHSNVTSGGSITVKGRRGLLVGGSCKATKSIIAKTMGSSMATATLLEVGSDPKLRLEQERIKTAIKDTKADIDKFEKIIIHLKNIDNEVGLSEERKEMLEKGMKMKEQLEEKRTVLETNLNDIDAKVSESSTGEIKIEDVMNPGVKIIMGSNTMLVQERTNRCKIYLDKEKSEIKIGSY